MILFLILVILVVIAFRIGKPIPRERFWNGVGVVVLASVAFLVWSFNTSTGRSLLAVMLG